MNKCDALPKEDRLQEDTTFRREIQKLEKASIEFDHVGNPRKPYGYGRFYLLVIPCNVLYAIFLHTLSIFLRFSP